MKRGFFELILIAVILIGTVGLSRVFAQGQKAEAEPTVVVGLPWKKDSEVSDWIRDTQHFYFGENELIDLNVIEIDDDLRASIDREGTDSFINQLMNGKNKINEMFSVGQAELLDYDLTKSGDLASLTLITTQAIGADQNNMVEVYFMRQGVGLHMELRWNAGAKSSDVETARASFDKIKADYERQP